ncbi:MAG: winged helix-turn-helix transcriptional regulator [Phycisphaerales bacterium]
MTRRPPPNPRDPVSPARLAALASLTHHRWAIPLLGECAASPVGGWKYVTFLHRLGISRDSLGRTLAALAALGWVHSNPGVPHALRPEYVLTSPGTRVAPACARLMKELRRLDLEDIGLQKWSLPVLLALSSGPRRFRDLRAALPDASPRALSLALRDLESAGLITRTLLDTHPPAAEYLATRRALRLAAGTRVLAFSLGLRTPGAATDPDQTARPQTRARAS